MPAATVTVRELKNKETGIDITIPTTKEIPGRLGTTTEYHVVVVTNLKCFKTPKHKDTDVVQFMLPKQLKEFEQLRDRLTASFPGTLFPPLPKRMQTFLGSSNASDRKSQLETFMKFIATTKKLTQHDVTLTFLGTTSLAAKQYLNRESKEEPTTATVSQVTEEQESPKEGLFDDIDEEETDLFTSSTQETDKTSDSLFSSTSAHATDISFSGKEARLFEVQDMGEGLNPADVEKGIFIPESSDPKPQVEIEDNSDLLKIEDDLDQLVKIDKKEKSRGKLEKPDKPVKPIPAPKPGGKKPPPPPKPTTHHSSLAAESQEAPGSDSMDTSDIMKYIQENEASKGSDVDLFS